MHRAEGLSSLENLGFELSKLCCFGSSVGRALALIHVLKSVSHQTIPHPVYEGGVSMHCMYVLLHSCSIHCMYVLLHSCSIHCMYVLLHSYSIPKNFMLTAGVRLADPPTCPFLSPTSSASLPGGPPTTLMYRICDSTTHSLHSINTERIACTSVCTLKSSTGRLKRRE